MGRPKGGKNRSHSKEEKLALVLRNLSGETLTSLERETGIYNAQIYKWTKQYLEGGEEESTNKVHKILGKVQKFVAADKTKELIIILLLLEAALFIFSILLGNLIAQILAVAGTAFVLYYAKNNYDFFKN